MEPFENNDPNFEESLTPDSDAPAQQEAHSSAYHGTGAGRKESPYANSPYMMPDPEPEPEYRRPSYAQRHVETKSQPRKLKKWHKVTLGVFGAAALVLTTFFATNAWWNNAHNDMMVETIESYQEELDELRQQIEDGLAALSPDHREVLILREIHQLAYDEIASVLQLDSGTVKSRINRARKQLRNFLLKSGNFSGAASSKSAEEGCK